MKPWTNYLNKIKPFIEKMVLAALIALFLTQLNLTRAKAETVCDFQSQFETIAHIKTNASTTDLERIQAELKIRKDILNSILACAIQDASSTKAKLNDIRLSDQEINEVLLRNQEVKILRNQFLNQLDAVINYYQNQKTKIEGLGIPESQDLAKEIKEWRTRTYTPLSKEVINFLIWVKNLELIKTTEQRFIQVNQTMRNLKVGNSEVIRNLLEKSRLNIETAKIGSLDAEKIFQDFSLAPKKSSLAFIKISLESLFKAYQNFFDIMDEIKKMLSP